MIAPGAVALADPLPKNIKASKRPRPGPGFASSKNRIDLPVAATCSVPIGVKIPWLMALFKKSILAGSIKILASGKRWALIIVSTPLAMTCVKASTIGPIKV